MRWVKAVPTENLLKYSGHFSLNDRQVNMYQVEMSECCKRLLNLLQRLQGKIDEFPPQEIQTRWLEPDLCF